MLPVSEYTNQHFVFMATSNGTVKKTALTNFARQRSVGLRAIELDEGDELVGTPSPTVNRTRCWSAAAGKPSGFRGRCQADGPNCERRTRDQNERRVPHDRADYSDSDQCILSVSENGYGKRTRSDEFPVYGRGGQGSLRCRRVTETGRLLVLPKSLTAMRGMLISIKVRWCARGLMKFQFREEILKGASDKAERR